MPDLLRYQLVDGPHAGEPTTERGEIERLARECRAAACQAGLDSTVVETRFNVVRSSLPAVMETVRTLRDYLPPEDWAGSSVRADGLARADAVAPVRAHSPWSDRTDGRGPSSPSGFSHVPRSRRGRWVGVDAARLATRGRRDYAVGLGVPGRRRPRRPDRPFRAGGEMAGWNGWAWLGGPVIGGRPVAGRNADGRLEVFGHASGGPGLEIVHAWQGAPGGGWSAWDSLGAPPTGNVGDLALGENGDGRLELFVREGLMSSGVAWHAWQEVPPATGWAAWDTLGSPPGGLANVTAEVGRNADGRLEVFAFASDGALWHIWQQATGGWSGWHSLGTPSGLFPFGLAVVAAADGRLAVFVVVLGGTLWRRQQSADPAIGWDAWEDLGMPAGVPLTGVSVGRNADGRLEVFSVGSTLDVWHRWETAPGGGLERLVEPRHARPRPARRPPGRRHQRRRPPGAVHRHPRRGRERGVARLAGRRLADRLERLGQPRRQPRRPRRRRQRRRAPGGLRHPRRRLPGRRDRRAAPLADRPRTAAGAPTSPGSRPWSGRSGGWPRRRAGRPSPGARPACSAARTPGSPGRPCRPRPPRA